MKEEFALPKEWYVIAKNTKENTILTDWINLNKANKNNPIVNNFLGDNRDTYTSDFECGSLFGKEITFKQFEQYVLNKSIKPEIITNYDYSTEFLNKLDIR